MGLLNLFKKEEPLIPNYVSLWGNCDFNILYGDEANSVKAKAIANRERYEVVSNETKVPWYLIAAIHYRESSQDFNTCLHNGDPLPGPTKHVPAGRGPFKSWEAAAVDALSLLKLPEAWSIEACLEFAENYNGLGYRKHGIYSPYVWAGTNHYQSGLYVQDGKFDPKKIDRRLGVACVILKIH